MNFEFNMIFVRFYRIFPVLFFLLSQALFAQKEGNIWYLNSVNGLNFNSGKAEQQAGFFWDFGVEGVSSICDKDGNLQLYANFDAILPRNHRPPILRGLRGCFSASQGVLIVQKPLSNRYYYVFITDGELNCSPGRSTLRYWEIDITLNNGLGGVTRSDSILTTNTTEEVAAIKHRNGIDIWLVTHHFNNNRFLSFRLTPEGITSDTLFNDAGPVRTCKYPGASGFIKFTPDGRQIANTNPYDKTVELYDFDDENGNITFRYAIPFPKDQVPYGVEFSTDLSYLYVSCLGDFDFNIQSIGNLYQFDLKNNNTSADLIKNAYVTPISESAGLWNHSGALLMGPDKKIYLARGPDSYYIGVINYPDKKGISCNFNARQITSIDKAPFSFAMPNLMSSYLYNPELLIEHFCLNDSTHFSIKNDKFITSLHWDFGDKEAGNANTSTDFPTTHLYQKSGEYIITLTYALKDGKKGTLKDTIKIYQLPEFTLGSDTTLCYQTELSLKPIIKNNVPVTFRWQDGSIQNEFVVKKPGLYWVEATSNQSCVFRDSIRIYWSPALVNLGKDTTLCYSQFITLNITIPGATYLWGNGSTKPIQTFDKTGTYWVTVTKDSCIDYDTLSITYHECEELIKIPNLFTPNNDDKNQTFFIEGIEEGKWQLSVFDRWGKKVYFSQDYFNNWDGNGASTGIYYFYLVNPQNRRKYTGWLQILR